MVGSHRDPSDQQRRVGDTVVKSQHRLGHQPGRGGLPPQIFAAVRLLRHLPAIAVDRHLATIGSAARRVAQVFDVIAHCQHHLIGHQLFFHQLQRQHLDHFPHDQSGFFVGVWALQHLPRAKTARCWFICLDIGDGAWLHAPRMVDQQTGIDAEGAVKPLLVPLRPQSDISHGVQSGSLQFAGSTCPHAPKIGEWSVLPQQSPVGQLVQFGNAHPVLIGFNVLGDDIHCHLAQIQVAADACRGGNSGAFQHLQHQPHGKFTGSQPVDPQVGSGVNEHLVDGVDMDILRCHKLQIDSVNFGAGFQVVCHLRLCHDVL